MGERAAVTAEALVLVDSEGTAVEVSRAAPGVLGRPAAEILGQNLADLVVLRESDGTRTDWPLDGSVDEHLVIDTPGDGSVTVVARAQTLTGVDGGGHKLVWLRLADPDGSDEPTAIEVISTVSHELRSPLTSVKGYTSLLLKRWDRLKDDQKQMMLEQVHHDADRVTRLVTELLDISRIETGRLNLRRQMISIPELAATVVEKLRVTYPDLECEIRFPDGYPRLYVDPDKIEQVLTNLVENAAKYADPTGMQITGDVDGEMASVAVVDTGDGIPAEDLPRVFQKFFRREIAQPSGTGLGLWISRGLVEAHGGTLEAFSDMGEGATFRFTCPVHAFDELHDAGTGSVAD